MGVKKPAPRFEGFSPSSQRASRIKERIKRYNTAPELRLRHALFAAGLRYRLHARHLPGRPDLIFPGARVAVFCDGDFWHGRNWKQRSTKLAAGSNAAYWLAKIAANRNRDRRHSRKLRAMGWTVIRVWESEILKNSEAQTQRIVRVIESKAPSPSKAR